MIAVFIPGRPVPKGNISFMGRTNSGKSILIDPTKNLKPWTVCVRMALLNDEGRPKAVFAGAVHVDVEFVMPRPKSAPKRSEPPATKKPDVDKLLRAVLDSVSSAQVWRDDSQVVSVMAEKRIARIGETPGCHLHITCAIERAGKQERCAA